MKSKKSRSDNICSSITDSKVYCPNVYDGWRMGILLKKFIINSITVISNRTVWNYFNKSYWLRCIENNCCWKRYLLNRPRKRDFYKPIEYLVSWNNFILLLLFFNTILFFNYYYLDKAYKKSTVYQMVKNWAFVSFVNICFIDWCWIWKRMLNLISIN